jgi:hypothetical protein
MEFVAIQQMILEYVSNLKLWNGLFVDYVFSKNEPFINAYTSG